MFLIETFFEEFWHCATEEGVGQQYNVVREGFSSQKSSHFFWISGFSYIQEKAIPKLIMIWQAWEAQNNNNILGAINTQKSMLKYWKKYFINTQTHMVAL